MSSAADFEARLTRLESEFAAHRDYDERIDSKSDKFYERSDKFYERQVKHSRVILFRLWCIIVLQVITLTAQIYTIATAPFPTESEMPQQQQELPAKELQGMCELRRET